MDDVSTTAAPPATLKTAGLVEWPDTSSSDEPDTTVKAITPITLIGLKSTGLDDETDSDSSSSTWEDIKKKLLG